MSSLNTNGNDVITDVCDTTKITAQQFENGRTIRLSNGVSAGPMMRRLHLNLRVVGLIFTMLCLVLFLAAEPAMRELVAGAIAVGTLVAFVMHFRGSSSTLNAGANYRVEQEYPHPGIMISRIRFGAGFAGLVFTIGCMSLFLAGLPVLWYPFVGAVALGIGVATVLHFSHR